MSHTVLVIAAHPDDELLGPGATLARHAAAGDRVHAVVLADGARSRYADGMIAVLEENARSAAAVLGLQSMQLLGYPDQMLDTFPIIELTQAVEDVVNRVTPTIVYTHCSADANEDHARVFQAAWTACRPYVAPQLERFAVYETPSSTEWGQPCSGGFVPNRYVDVAGTIDVKLLAMSCYTSELRDYPHPRSLRALTERAAFWGSRVGVASAEAFQVLREVER